MSREIKFRALFTPDNEWIDFSLDDVARLGDIFINYKHWRRYTGLKDKNGVKIYEGDILHTNDNWSPKRTPHKLLVEWHEQDGCYKASNRRWHSSASHFNLGTVIGNIYENPELLQEAA